MIHFVEVLRKFVSHLGHLCGGKEWPLVFLELSKPTNIRCLVGAAINYGFMLVHFEKLLKVAGALYHV